MRIDRVTVTGLFGRFNHDLQFKAEERIAIMIGPNGFGKTMILRIINTLFNRPVQGLGRLPFENVAVRFDDNSELGVSRRRARGGHVPEVELTHRGRTGGVTRVRVTPLDARALHLPLELIDDWVPTLRRVGPSEWRDLQAGETLSLEEVLARYEDSLPSVVSSEAAANLPDWLQGLRAAIPVRLVDVDRVSSRVGDQGRLVRARGSSGATAVARTVRLYSQDLAERIQKTFTEYASLAQTLDQTFPARVVEEQPLPVNGWGMDTLREELRAIEARRAELVQAGLLGSESAGFGVGIPALDKVDESKRGVLGVYAGDARRKLSVFDDLYARVEAFVRIANSRFLHKKVAVAPDGLHVTAPDGSSLELEMLSSGEQHELVILYELLFRVPNNSFIMIDEPELSLHVAWQAEFLTDLEEMAKLSKFRVLLATHSPQIIGDRWDLTVELRGPDGE